MIVGDTDGADSSIQQQLLKLGCKKTTVFCSRFPTRNNLGLRSIHVVKTDYASGSRAFFTAKDLKMADEADYGLMIWDTKSTGTLSNVIELLKRKKSL